jgi:hypothetical protein
VVDGVSYIVETAFNVAKPEIATVPGLWEHNAGRVVLITCVPRLDGGEATHNRVTALNREE